MCRDCSSRCYMCDDPWMRWVYKEKTKELRGWIDYSSNAIWITSMASIQIFIKVEDTNPNRMKFHWKTIAKKNKKIKHDYQRKRLLPKLKSFMIELECKKLKLYKTLYRTHSHTTEVYQWIIRVDIKPNEEGITY